MLSLADGRRALSEYSHREMRPDRERDKDNAYGEGASRGLRADASEHDGQRNGSAYQ